MQGKIIELLGIVPNCSDFALHHRIRKLKFRKDLDRIGTNFDFEIFCFC